MPINRSCTYKPMGPPGFQVGIFLLVRPARRQTGAICKGRGVCPSCTTRRMASLDDAQGNGAHVSLLQNAICVAEFSRGDRRNEEMQVAISGMLRFSRQNHNDLPVSISEQF